MNSTPHIYAVSIIMLVVVSCSTQQTAVNSKLPEKKQPSPVYDTDDVLLAKVEKLEKELEKNPTDQQLQLQLAALHQDLGQTEQALSYMESLSESGYNEDPRLYGSMASLYASRDEHEKALKNYQKFRSELPESSEVATKVDEKIAQQIFILEQKADPADINLRPLPSPINTSNSEYLPQWSLDEETVIFTRRLHGQEDLIEGTWDGDRYVTKAISELNSPLNEGAHTISADGRYMVFTFCDKRAGFGSCDLFRTRRQDDGSWSKPVNMGRRINTVFWDGQPSLSADGRFLYFVSNREGGQGGRDIWASRRGNDGRWSNPINLGSKVNTQGNEASPFIHADGKTLYMRSNGRLSMGGYDLYKSTLEEGKWTTPSHLGSPINTTGEDGALAISLDGTRGYYATDNYQGIQSDHLDLYEFDLPMEYRPSPMTFVRGRVTDVASGLPIAARVKITYLDDSKYKSYYTTDIDGNFLAALPVGTPTLLHVSSEGYAFYSDHISYTEVRHSVDPYEVDLSLEKLRTTTASTDKAALEPIVLRNIFFETGSAELLSSSDEEINTVYQLLEDQPSITIEIIGHTDNIGSDQDNQALSLQRATSVRTAIIAKGAAANRITATGLGESRPIDTNDTEEGRARNRRTEMVIIN